MGSKYQNQLPVSVPNTNDYVTGVQGGKSYNFLISDARDKALRTEVENARNGQANLSAELSAISNSISTVSNNLSQLSNPNLLINGDFQVWQRGTNFSGPTYTTSYSTDRWKISTDATAYSVAKADEGITMSLTTGGSDFAIIQSFENDNVIPLRGKKLTFSVDLKLGANTTSGNIAIVLYYGTVANELLATTGRVSSTLNVPVSSLSTTAFTRVSLTTDTLSSNANSLCVMIRTNSEMGQINNGGSFIARRAKLELGSISTPSVPRLYSEELALCQRYYEPIYLPAVIRADEGYSYKGTYKVVKRATPTLYYESVNGALGSLSFYDGSVWNDTSSISIDWTNTLGYSLALSIATNSVCLLNGLFHADAEIY